MDIIAKNAVPGTFRDLNTVETEIRVLKNQAQNLALTYAVEIGRRLSEGKSMLPEGKSFEQWALEEFEFKKSSAYNFVKLFEEYGADQVNFFGETRFQPVGKLSYSKALRLLCLPEEEREEFIETHDVENMSRRELDAALKERDAEKKAREAAEEQAKKAEAELNAMREEADSIYEKAEKNARAAAEEERKGLLETVDRLRNLADEEQKKKSAEFTKLQVENTDLEMAKRAAEKELAKAREELEKAKAEAGKPQELSQAEIEKIKESARAEQAEAVKKAEEEIERLKKQIAVSDKDMASFETYFNLMQENFNRMTGIILKISGHDSEKAAKLKTITETVLKSLTDKLNRL